MIERLSRATCFCVLLRGAEADLPLRLGARVPLYLELDHWLWLGVRGRAVAEWCKELVQ